MFVTDRINHRIPEDRPERDGITFAGSTAGYRMWRGAERDVQLAHRELHDQEDNL